MDSMYVLIPVSLLLVLGIGGLLAWSVLGGQFDELDREGQSILTDDQQQQNPDTNLAADPPNARVRGATVRGSHGGNPPGAS
jgi:cbb3-type cytochrome oxidase maturation protein